MTSKLLKFPILFLTLSAQALAIYREKYCIKPQNVSFIKFSPLLNQRQKQNNKNNLLNIMIIYKYKST